MIAVAASISCRRMCLLADDLGVELEVGRGGHRVHQLGQVVDAADRLQLAAAEQLVPQGDVIDDHPPFEQPAHGPEQPAMGLAVEHAVVEQLRGTERGVLVQHHGAEDRLLGFVAPGRRAARRRCQASSSCRAIRTSSQVGFFQFGLRSSAAGW